MLGKNKEQLKEELNNLQKQILIARGDIVFFEDKKKNILSEINDLDLELINKSKKIEEEIAKLDNEYDRRINELDNEFVEKKEAYDVKFRILKNGISDLLKENENLLIIKKNILKNIDDYRLDLDTLENERNLLLEHMGSIGKNISSTKTAIEDQKSTIENQQTIIEKNKILITQQKETTKKCSDIIVSQYNEITYKQSIIDGLNIKKEEIENEISRLQYEHDGKIDSIKQYETEKISEINNKIHNMEAAADEEIITKKNLLSIESDRLTNLNNNIKQQEIEINKRIDFIKEREMVCINIEKDKKNLEDSKKSLAAEKENFQLEKIEFEDKKRKFLLKSKGVDGN